MAIFSAAEIAQLKDAYLQLMLGKRVVAKEVGGVRTEFQRIDLDRIKAILEENDALEGNVPLRTYAKNGSVSV
ncbi:MAG: hypothetical protein M0036_10310 [Desulfobacteraceae bacterium]|nr:hypothetical protein [Desulfobacteraceae bacterium]